MTQVRSYPDRDLIRQLWLEAAHDWLGTPYRHQGSSKHVGADCLGLVLGCWREIYAKTPDHDADYTMDWAEARQDEPLLRACGAHCGPVEFYQALPGDIAAFRWRTGTTAKHLGILLPGSRMIHARQKHAVCETRFDGFWRKKLAGVFRPPLAPLKTRDH